LYSFPHEETNWNLDSNDSNFSEKTAKNTKIPYDLLKNQEKSKQRHKCQSCKNWFAETLIFGFCGDCFERAKQKIEKYNDFKNNNDTKRNDAKETQ